MSIGDIMKIYEMETNEVILKEIGIRIKSRRIGLAITQKELALESGVSLRTIANVENGKNVSLENLISILRVIKRADNLELLLPESKTNPMDILDFGHSRKRVSKTKNDTNSRWKWGDEK